MKRTLLIALLTLSSVSFGQQGFYFILNPGEPFTNQHWSYTDQTIQLDTMYEDTYYEGGGTEWRPNRSLGFEMGHQFSNGFMVGGAARLVSDMFDISIEISAQGSLGYRFKGAPLAVYARGGYYGGPGNNANSYSVGGLLDFYFPMNSDKFSMGLRTGYSYIPLYRDREYRNDWGSSININTSSLIYHMVDLGMVFKWM